MVLPLPAFALDVLLTFNITLHELVTGMAGSFARFWVTIWSVPEYDRAEPRIARAPSMPAAPRAADTPAFEPPPGADELGMLEMTATPARPGSRLSCQIVLDPMLEGLLVETPVAQY